MAHDFLKDYDSIIEEVAWLLNYRNRLYHWIMSVILSGLTQKLKALGIYQADWLEKVYTNYIHNHAGLSQGPLTLADSVLPCT